MAEMTTRCPHCGTAFRITPAHLKSARGSVRCGSCLQVFNARENLSGAPAESAAVATGPAAEIPEQSQQTEQDDLLISDDMGLGVEDDSEALLPDEEDQQQGNLFERELSRSDTESDQNEAADESWALQLLDEDEPGFEPDQSHPDNRKVNPAEVTERTARESDATRNPATHSDLEDETAAAEDVENLPHNTNRPANPYLDAIEPEPVEFAYRGRKTFWQRRWVWALLSLLALALLLAQIAWLQYPNLNRLEPYRGWYGAACKFLGCQLPLQQELEAIRTSNLVVRSHPQETNALMVDVVLQNNAPFTQPFPDLELSFSDLKGRTLAQRRFTAEEYLGGELSGRSDMPVNQPIHIALEIVDPGEQAVNYRIHVASSTP